jgi:hypothetical protein
MVQAFLPSVSEGDKRIVLVDGEPAGAINRLPKKGEIRSNLAAGGSAQPTELTAREQEICARLGPELKKRGLIFVGIDVIGEYLTEINVTSPTGAPFFHYQAGELRAEGVSLAELGQELGTPLYVYSRGALAAAWASYQEACVGHEVLVCFGMKANSNLAVLKEFARLGSGFDIVSGGELARVLAAGADPAKVVFSGVGKQ